MSITQNASRVRVESAAKNGTLGTQGTLDANQIKLDTAITTNNGNLEASPSLKWRHIILRRGELDEEHGMVQSVEVDGLTCNCYQDWESAPASGDTYDIAYRLEDVATIAGCDFETDSRQWVMSKRFIVSDGTNFAFFGISHGQVFRLEDSESATESSFRVGGTGVFCIGTLTRNDLAERGATLIFQNDADDELVMDWLSGAKGRLYEFTMISARAPDGVIGLEVTVDAAATVEWARVQTHGMDTPFTKTIKRFKTVGGVYLGTKAELLAEFGHLLSPNTDQVLKDELALLGSGTHVRLLFEEEA